MPTPASKDVRRVVTTHDESGKAVILLDGPSPHRIVRGGEGGTVLHNLWVTDETPADMKGKADKMARQIDIPPPKSGSVIRVLDIPPIGDVSTLDNGQMQAHLPAEHSHPRAKKPRHPMMHRTRTIDYAIILSGEIDMLLDDTEVHLKAGDILVQQATNHAWVNRSKEYCRICFVLIDGKEPLA
jgi:mannose-6-phosphate isomerase-like protein (cupin superfamily)